MTEAEEMEELIWKRRKDKFVSEGCPEPQAHELAATMMLRDREDDPDCLRTCFECKHLKGRHCEGITDRFGKPTTQMRFILQRCPTFVLKGKK
jgi:hypothetical protein